ncbi:MAG: WhiB family redox-sensing transcriptional regulator [Acidimicrobiales bacterium]|jgi:WhiB family redox-sensing transcriptional regulator
MTLALEPTEYLRPPRATASPLAEDWWSAATCRTVSKAKDIFFSEDLPDIAAAKQVCADCPVIAPCLEGAIRRGEPWGVWGGQLFAKGRIVTIKRKRGRPPKNPRPEDRLPDIPVPDHLQRLIA